MRILGLMSGTSSDGLDYCDVEIDIDLDYNFKFDIYDFNTIPFSDSEKNFLLSMRECESDYPNFSKEITNLFISKIEEFIDDFNFDLIACHGYTVKHIDKVLSVQLIDAKLLYKKFKVPVTYNFRQNDIVLGGSGAPLMPFLDWVLFSDLDKDILTLNIGGISNITYIPNSKKRDEVIGFDTGPGMSLVDKATMRIFNEQYDIDAKYSKKGSVNSKLLEQLMKNNYIITIPPKSTDTYNFGNKLLDEIISQNKDLDSFDLIRTLIQFTVDSIHYNIINFINLTDSNYNLVYSGGGTDHPIILDIFKMKKINLKSISEYGIDSSVKEALLIALLGACKVLNLNSNMPSVTGAKSCCVLGDIYSG